MYKALAKPLDDMQPFFAKHIDVSQVIPVQQTQVGRPKFTRKLHKFLMRRVLILLGMSVPITKADLKNMEHSWNNAKDTLTVQLKQLLMSEDMTPLLKKMLSHTSQLH